MPASAESLVLPRPRFAASLCKQYDVSTMMRAWSSQKILRYALLYPHNGADSDREALPEYYLIQTLGGGLRLSSVDTRSYISSPGLRDMIARHCMLRRNHVLPDRTYVPLDLRWPWTTVGLRVGARPGSYAMRIGTFNGHFQGYRTAVELFQRDVIHHGAYRLQIVVLQNPQYLDDARSVATAGQT